jgi:hypothetical protein
MKKHTTILFLFFLTFLFGCGTNEKEIVINLDEIKDITIEKFTDFTITDSQGDIVYFDQVRDIISGSDSSIIIIDIKRSRLVQLDKYGNFKKYVGRQGSGPGEFNSPMGGVFYNNNQYIVDNYGQIIQKYDKDMNYLTSYKTSLFMSCDIVFINENEIVSVNDGSDEYIFCIRDTLGNIIRSFGDIKENEDGVVDKEKRRRTIVRFVYDSLYKHIFCFPSYEPVIKRFDLDGNLLQQINFEGNIIDEIRASSNRAKQHYANMPNTSAGAPCLTNPSIIEGHKLLMTIPRFGSVILHYDDKNIIDKRVVKLEMDVKSGIPALKDFNNIKLIYIYTTGEIYINSH